eukprot:GGOE01046486.1.p2 GENE.GGOE01046486.1~~GGOE01046486.1.p2  ORF type:complete len:240 (-),score=26.71 GGOE01046486.1:256-975(-)
MPPPLARPLVRCCPHPPSLLRSSRSLLKASGDVVASRPRRTVSVPVTRVSKTVDWSLFLAHDSAAPNFGERFAPTKVVEDVRYLEGPTLIGNVRLGAVSSPSPSSPQPPDTPQAERQPRASASADAHRRSLSAPSSSRGGAQRRLTPDPFHLQPSKPPAAEQPPLAAAGWKPLPKAQLRTPPKAASPFPTLHYRPPAATPLALGALHPVCNSVYATISPTATVFPMSPCPYLEPRQIHF